MNKKFLSAVLFGALLASSTGTFVSCKDYDDDITELWDAVNGQKTDLTAKVTAVESSIASLTSAQTALETKIAEAEDAAEKAALAAKEAAIKAAKEDLEAVKAELEATIAGLQNDSEANKDAIAKANAAITEVKGSISTLEATVAGVAEKAAENLAAAVTTLESKISGLADDVKANAEKIGSLETAIKTQQEALKEYAKATDVSANASAIDALQKELTAQQEVLEKLDAFDTAATQSAIETLTSDLSALSTKVNSLDSRINTLSTAINALKGMVTSVSLVASYENEDALNQYNPALRFYTATEVDSKFGPNSELAFVKGTKVEWSNKLLIRVSPTNAVLTPEDITLINSKGEEFGLAKVTKVSHYENLLTATRGIADNGLWVVETALAADYDEATFKAATQNKKDGKDILFAVAVSNEDAADGGKRNVISNYSLTIEHKAYEQAEFKFKVAANTEVEAKSLSELKNRWSIWGAADGASSEAKEYKWAKEAYATPVEDKIKEDDGSDARSNKPELHVQLGVPFIVESDNSDIKDFYVALDEDFAEEGSEPSEINIWKTYAKTMTGLNQLASTFEDGKVAITITDELANRDIIGFRVYAVNYDGTLVDPDGRAFYVAVGNAVAETSVAGKFVPNAELGGTLKINADTLDIEIGDWAEKVEYINWSLNEPELKADGVEPMWGVDLVQGKEGYTTINSGAPISADVKALAKVTGIAASISTNLIADFIDGYTYTGKLEFLDKNNSVIKTINVSYTKELPGAPSFLKVKDGQLEGNTLNCFVLPGATTSDGYYSSALVKMNEIFTGWSKNATVTFATSDVKNEAYTEDKQVSYNNSDDKLMIDAVLVDNKTEHATKVEYTYPRISTYYDNVAYKWVVGEDYKVTAMEFNTVYKCIFHAPNYNFAWYTKAELVKVGLLTDKDNMPYPIKENAPVLTYGETLVLTKGTWAELIQGKSVYYPARYTNNYQMFATKLGYTIDNTSGNGGQAFYPEKGRVNSGGTLEEDYFNVSVNPVGTISISVNSDYAQNAPKADVKSTLEITGKDYFGHEMTISLPIWVSPAK